MAGTGRRREAGSTLVEFGLSIMVLMTLMLGVVEFGRGLYAYHFVSSAARRTARWAAVNGSTCSGDGSCAGTDGMNNGYATAAEIQNYATGLAPTGISSSDVTATACWPDSSVATCSPASTVTEPSQCTSNPTELGCNCYNANIGDDNSYANSPGCTVEVTVAYDFHFIFPFVHNGTLQFSSTAQSIITH